MYLWCDIVYTVWDRACDVKDKGEQSQLKMMHSQEATIDGDDEKLPLIELPKRKPKDRYIYISIASYRKFLVY